MSDQTQSAVSAVLDVLRRDEHGQSASCYFPYLACMQQALLAATESAADTGRLDQLSARQLDEQRRLLGLMRLCLNRTWDLLEGAAKPVAAQPPAGAAAPAAVQHQTPAPQRPQQQQTPPPQPPAQSFGSRRSPMQEAIEQNRRLYSAFLARTSALPQGDPRRVTLRLALQRRLDENLQLARPKQAAFEISLQEDLLAKRADCGRLFQMHAAVFQFDDGSPALEDCDFKDSELRALYCRCSEFEYLVLFKDHLYQKSANQPSMRLQYLLSIPEHPLTAFIASFSDRLEQRMSATAPTSTEGDADGNANADADAEATCGPAGQAACRLLRRLAPAACLLCGDGGGPAGHEVAACSAALAGRLLGPRFESRALAHLGIALRPHLTRLAGVAAAAAASPGDLVGVCSVDERFRGLVTASPVDEGLAEAREILGRMCAMPGTPLAKCHLLQELLNRVLGSMRAHRLRASGSEGGGHCELGADDLLPVLAFVVATCGQAALLCQLKYIEYFLDDSHMLGAEGYSFTSVYTAVMAVLSADSAIAVPARNAT